MDRELKGRTAWVVGASGTIGAQISRDLAAAGADVFVSGRRSEPLAGLAAVALREDDLRLRPLVVDITRRDSVDAGVRHILGETEHIDILVNTSSLSLFGDFLELDDDVWEQVLQTKYLGYVRTIRAVLPHMRKQGSGVVVSVTGKGGRVPRDIHLPGCTVNAAINLLTRGLAATCGGDGVRIVAVAPGVIESPRLAAIGTASARANRLDAAGTRQAIQGSNSLGRLGTARDVSAAVLFAVSDRGGFVNGTVIEVDGG